MSPKGSTAALVTPFSIIFCLINRIIEGIQFAGRIFQELRSDAGKGGQREILDFTPKAILNDDKRALAEFGNHF